MTETSIRVRVECYAGHRGEETPRRMYFGEREIVIAEVIDQWLAPDHRYFKVRSEEGASYILRHDVATGTWELIMFERAGSEAPTGVRGTDG